MGRESIPAASKREAAGEHERGSEAGGDTDAGVAPAEAAVLDLHDERDWFLLALGLRRRSADGGEQAEGGECDRGSDAEPTGCCRDRVHGPDPVWRRQQTMEVGPKQR